MDHIITAKDIAVRDSRPSVHEWVRVTSIQLKTKGSCPVTFNGQVKGKPVYAYISNWRAMAICDQPGCAGCEYVDPKEPIFFCLTCGNGGSGAARPVMFPSNWEMIGKMLLEREMIPGIGKEIVMQTLTARPRHRELRGDWMPQELEPMKDHPAISGRVLVEKYDETPSAIKARTLEVQHASQL